MFSDVDIERALDAHRNNPEEGLDIVPFEKIKYLTPVGYDLRVGREGYSWNRKEVIQIERDGKIIINANDTVVIRTLETITLSKKIAATIHSIVSKTITKGLSDISTTIDPGWSGKLLISIHNYRDSPTELRFGEYFCTVCFYSVESPSQINLDRRSDRDDLWEQLLEKAEAEKRRIAQAKNQEANRIKNENRSRVIALLLLSIFVLIGGVTASLSMPELGASIAGFLAVITPVVYDKLKPISKP